MTKPLRGYRSVIEVAPKSKDILLLKKQPNAFFGTYLTSDLVGLGADSLVVAGCTTSGYVRGSVIHAFTYNDHVLVPSDAIYDRSDISHAVNLFDMSEKHADVMTPDYAVDAELLTGCVQF